MYFQRVQFPNSEIMSDLQVHMRSESDHILRLIRSIHFGGDQERDDGENSTLTLREGPLQSPTQLRVEGIESSSEIGEPVVAGTSVFLRLLLLGRTFIAQ